MWASAPAAAWAVIAACLVAIVVMTFFGAGREDAPPWSPPADFVASLNETPVEPPTAVILGDSFTAGAGAEGISNGFARQTCLAMNWSCNILGVGGSGYTNLDDDGTPGSTFGGDRLQALVAAAPDIVVIQGSTNDSATDPVETAATELYRAITTALPETTIVAVGPVDPPVHAAARVLGVRDQLVAATTAEGVAFIDPIAEGWLPEGDAELYAPDRHHPSREGHRVFAERLASDLRALNIPADGA